MSDTEHGPRARRLPRADAPPPAWDERRLTTVQRSLLSWQRRLGGFGTIAVISLGMALISVVFVCGVAAMIVGIRDALSWQYLVFSFITPLLLIPPTLQQILKLLDVLSNLSEDYRQLAEQDQLTGLLNRRGLFERAAELSTGAVVAMADLDDFKSVNDRHGHDFGDRVLVAAARRLIGAAGPGAVVARTGGDEFVVLLPTGGDLPTSLDLEVAAVPVRMSIGVARYVEEAGMDAALLAADDALYAVKTGHGQPLARRRPMLDGPSG